MAKIKNKEMLRDVGTVRDITKYYINQFKTKYGISEGQAKKVLVSCLENKGIIDCIDDQANFIINDEF